MAKFGLNTFTINQIDVVSSSKSQLLIEIEKKITSRHKIFIVTPNPEFIIFAKENPWFKAILKKADLAIPDGVGLVWASRFLARKENTSEVKHRLRHEGTSEVEQGGESIKERISGTDLMQDLCRLAAKKGWTVYLLGGRTGVAKKALAVLKKRYPRLKGWAETGPTLEDTPGVKQGLGPENTPGVKPSAGHLRGGKWVERINQKSPTFLFVGMGMGKQEKFIADNWKKLDVKLAMGVGGAFDYLSGEIPRAPRWIRNLGLEWLYRLIREPWRWRRHLRLIKFVQLVVKEKLSL